MLLLIGHLPAQQLTNLRVTLDWKIGAEAAGLSPLSNLSASGRQQLAVVQQADFLVRIFGPDGHSAGSFGRRGEGPGEFRDVSKVWWIGDTLAIYDQGLRRVTFVSPQLKLLRTVRVPLQVTFPGSIRQPPVIEYFSFSALYRDGTWLVAPIVSSHGPPPPWQSEVHAKELPSLLIGPEGEFRRVAFWQPTPSDRCVLSYAVPNGNGTIGIPYCSNAIVKSSEDGTRLAFITYPDASHATPRFDLKVVAQSGETLISRTIPYVPISIPPRILDSTRARNIAAARDPQAAAAYTSMKLPTSYPPVRLFLVGQDGSIWLEERIVGLGHSWNLYDSQGRSIGRLLLPQNTSIWKTDYSKRLFWGVETDEDGLQSIVRYHLN